MTEGTPPASVARPKILKDKPLIEAILEVRWKLEPGPVPGMLRDPHYSLLVGALFEKAKVGFSHHEELPTASVPADMTPHIVQHRFRPAANGWPLLQVGPGVFTVNETQGYTWERFERLINDGIRDLISSHPKPDALQFETLMLRYVNAVRISQQENVVRFLAEKMSTTLQLPAAIFADGNVREAPIRLATEFVFPSKKPAGVLQLKFSTGLKEKEPALIFEEWFVSSKGDVPTMPNGFREWAASAHGVVEDAFFRLIEGELEKEFGADD